MYGLQKKIVDVGSSHAYNINRSNVLRAGTLALPNTAVCSSPNLIFLFVFLTALIMAVRACIDVITGH